MLKKLNKNDIMLKIKYITNLKYRYVTGNLKNTQTLLFYGLPKIHKIFISLPPLRPNAPGVCVCVFTSIHLEGFICLGLVVQGTD